MLETTYFSQEAVTSLLAYTARRRAELMTLHARLFPSDSDPPLALIDKITTGGSIARIGSLQISGSSARLAELAAQKKRAILQQQLHKVEAQAKPEQEMCAKDAEAEREMRTRDVEAAQKIREAKAQIELADIEAEKEREIVVGSLTSSCRSWHTIRKRG